MSSATNLAVIIFLLLVTLWLFMRRGEARDRLFLAVAGVLFIAAMGATFWKFGETGKVQLIGELLLETIGLGLVMLSRRVKKTK